MSEELIKRLQEIMLNKYGVDLDDSDISALSQQAEPVAWMYHDGESPDKPPSPLAGSTLLSFERMPNYRNERPLYTTTQSGVREGMLRAADIVRNGRFLHDQAPAKRFADEAAAAITRAADQVSQQDAVSVPKQLKAFVKWARDMRSKHALSLIDAIAIDGVIDRITALLDSNKRTPYTNADNGSYGPEYQGQPPLPKGE